MSKRQILPPAKRQQNLGIVLVRLKKVLALISDNSSCRCSRGQKQGAKEYKEIAAKARPYWFAEI
jgi:hypothetical protein